MAAAAAARQRGPNEMAPVARLHRVAGRAARPPQLTSFRLWQASPSRVSRLRPLIDYDSSMYEAAH